MKNPIRPILCFALFFVFCNKNVLAIEYVPRVVDSEKIKIITTAVPTPTTGVLIKPNIEIGIEKIPFATKTPTPIVVVQIVTTTSEPIKPTETNPQIKPTDSEKITVTPSSLEKVVVEPTVEEIQNTEKTREKTDSDKWFWGIIIALLVLILAVQVWSTREKKEYKDK